VNNLFKGCPRHTEKVKKRQTTVVKTFLKLNYRDYIILASIFNISLYIDLSELGLFFMGKVQKKPKLMQNSYLKTFKELNPH
jgi:hypothetical protein